MSGYEQGFTIGGARLRLDTHNSTQEADVKPTATDSKQLIAELLGELSSIHELLA